MKSRAGDYGRGWAAVLAARSLITLVLFALLSFTSAPTARAGVPVTLFESFAGNLDFVGTAGSLRVGNCGVTPSGTGNLAGIPASATIVAAYLYWAGSGATADNTVTFVGPGGGSSTVSADRTFADDFAFAGVTYDFFSAFADVTSTVAAGRNGAYTMSNLTFDNGAPFNGIAVCLGGWSLVVIYEDASEPLRVVNVFDGFENFRGSSILLTPDNFVVPASPINGKLGHITWEGDAGNSGEIPPFSEELSFEGVVLFDADNPVGNQFNSVSNVTSPVSNTPGVDFDVYDLTAPELFAGQTSGASLYESGSDRVILTAEIFSVTNTPVSNLSLTKVSTDDFIAGTSASWTLTVANDGPVDDPGPIVITDPLPSGTSFVSASGSGWTCSELTGTVTCSSPSGVLDGAALPPVTLEVLVDPGATGSISNTATVAGGNFDNATGNNSSTSVSPIVIPDLSTSTKSVVDLNGGEADPGDVLRYTITLTESAGFAASDVTVTDDIPAGVTDFIVDTLPAGATDASTFGTTGANGSGFLDIRDLTVPASGSIEIVFDVTIGAGLSSGSVISNTAAILLPSGESENPSAPDIIVSASQAPASGTKQLYLGNPAGGGRALSRNAPNGLPPSATLGLVTIDRTDSETWTLSDPLAAPLSLSGDDFSVALWLRRGNTNAGNVTRMIRVSVASTSLGTIATTDQTVAVNGTPSRVDFTMNPGATLPATLPAGDVITLTVQNITGGGGNQRFRLFPAVAGAGGGNSRIELNALTVVNVDSVAVFDAPAPGGSTVISFAPGDLVSLRAVVSDPFGAFDISGAMVEVVDPSGVTVFGPSAMSELTGEETASTKTFESNPGGLSGLTSLGTWTVRVIASEGEEGTITDLGIGSFLVSNNPDLVIFKSVTVLDDPVNDSANPKAIPGANVIYTIGISNQGAGAADAGSIVIEDALPPELELFVDDYVTPGPVYFVDGAAASGLAVSFISLADDSDDLEFDDGSGLWDLDPVADSEGFDQNVSAFRITPTGSFLGTSGTPPSFQIRFRARIR